MGRSPRKGETMTTQDHKDMTAVGFTPGPWARFFTPHKSAPGSYAVVATTTGLDRHATICWIDGETEEHDANSRLVAAAPALYAACRNAEAFLDQWMHGQRHQETMTILAMLRAALARAEGKKIP